MPDAAVIGAQKLGLPGPLDPANISKQAGSSSMKACDLPALSFPEVLRAGRPRKAWRCCEAGWPHTLATQATTKADLFLTNLAGVQGS